MVPSTVSRVVRVADQHGLHFRPASAIVQTANRYQSKVTVHRGIQTADAASMLDLLCLGAAQGTELVLSVSGPDALEAIEAVAQLFSPTSALGQCA
jgi:phosphocarrier protein HPr